MPEYKLVYFNGRGLAELARWIFIYGDIPFTDERVEREDWPERKKTTPGGKLPLMYIDDRGTPLWQSLAIARYGATLAGLIPDNPIFAAYCEAFTESTKELLTEMYKITLLSEKSEPEKEKELKEEYFPKMLAPFLEKINKKMETHEWLIADKISWADIAIGRTLDELMIHLGDEIKKYPAALAHAQKIQKLPKIKEWREKRPNSPF